MIKRMTGTDIGLVQNMLEEKGTDIKSINNMKDFLLNDSNYFIAYLDKEKIIGFLLAYRLQRYDGRNEMLYLHEIDVLESYRKCGIATKLMDELKSICQENHYDKIFLITNKSNQAAVALYESTGGLSSSDDDIIFAFK